jgi:hypothetical protein
MPLKSRPWQCIFLEVVRGFKKFCIFLEVVRGFKKFCLSDEMEVEKKARYTGSGHEAR